MHHTIKNLKYINSLINSKLEGQKIDKMPKIVAVSKTFELEKIMPLIEHGHLDFGENKVQEALEKWSEVKLNKPNIKLHLIGKLQTNKVKYAIKIFDYIHSLDSEKLAKKIADEEQKHNKKLNLFIQINLGNENQKSGVHKDQIAEFYNYCIKLNLNIIGLMCIPPINTDSENYFREMKLFKKKLNLQELSMGMSSDYLKAINNSSTYLRIGSSIFGSRN
jgi:pyridoxal phosphate enzyme (YggS family)